MKINNILEAKYAFRQDSKCHACGHEFNFHEEAEQRFFKDSVDCPKCGAENLLDHASKRKKKSDETKRNI